MAEKSIPSSHPFLTRLVSPRSIQQVQFRARPTAALKARPVVVAKAHFGVFAAAVRAFPAP
jgi:hypothetical protein